MARALGNYAPRAVHVELVLDGQYQGVYLLTERIKPDKNRLDITKMSPEDNSGNALTGGYIYEVAKGWVSVEETLSGIEGDTRRLKYPKPDEITDEQRAYITNYDDGFRNLAEQPDFADPVYGYSAWIDVQSFIDEILIQELTKNSDAYGWSSHFHKDRLGKLRAGPAWDFDQALSNSTAYCGDCSNRWQIDVTDEIGTWGGDYPAFWLRLFRDETFRGQLIDRWLAMREGAWSKASLIAKIDSMTANLEEAQERNFEIWPILGEEVWRSLPGWRERDTYAKEVDYLKDFVIVRLAWMDDQLLGRPVALLPIKQAVAYEPAVTAYPNPIRSHTMLRYHIPVDGPSSIIVHNLLGQEVRRISLGNQVKGAYQIFWDGNDSAGRMAANGVYLISIQVGSNVKTSKVSILR
jgi:hypothetical protein